MAAAPSSSAAYALRLAGSRVLRSVARPVRSGEASSLDPLLVAMTDLLRSEKARGLSAPQLGESLRLFMLTDTEKITDPEEAAKSPIVALNPRILRRSKGRRVDWEACLSVPDYGALVSRPARIEVAYETLEGGEVRRALHGDLARVFQHEIDHLDGVLFLERMLPTSLTHQSLILDPQRREEIEDALTEGLTPEQDERIGKG